ncbi:glycoside hydrolase family 10 [Planctomycetes bacterium K23_9]|uniref:GH10 domain-containing protein n=1 Tax=Stieleria marina TaxID=1930275 RepID=A0A517NX80_9BACT|nr:hypothetical protein K239x_37190 [Planctomycetes bacterium K23_9]
MGQFHFDVPSQAKSFIDQSLWKDAYITGIEGIPWQSNSQYDGSRLTITRSIESSGKLSIACPIDGLGYRTLATCSLRPTAAPHCLPLELARGSCYRVRIQSDIWQRAGLTLSQKFQDLTEQGTQRFLDATLARDDHDESAVAALESIALLEEAVLDLGESYAVQSISFRKQREPQIGTLLAGTVIPPSPSQSANANLFREAFNAAAVRLSWADIETDAGRYDYDDSEQTIRWCTTNGVRVIGGPLLDFREKLMPHWLYLLEDNFDEFLNAVINFVEKTVIKFRGSVQLWNCAAGLNTPGPLNLDDEQIMRLALGILQTVRRADPNAPAIITFDQPYGEYLSKCRDGISPMHFADALARSGLGMAGLGLDVRMNYTSGATLPRSAVDFGLMIDRWATLGMPLMVQLAIPGGADKDLTAIAPSDVLGAGLASSVPASDQLRMAAPLIRTLLAKHTVHGIVWDGWSDAEAHVLSHSGLIDSNGQSRPLLEYLKRVRKEFLA